MNTFSSLLLSGYSPFEIDFMRKAADLLHLAFLPLEQFSNIHKVLLQLMKKNQYLGQVFC